eukprot:TRINITY_DN43347_c0_g1_i1.p1 TRINITY_DN43347_c0_g1~~TRINITY_DN43347_c0_g1_i1.p1  ORF type:complete len:540 (+),score=73.04 TRINITY_DN43347_c0_g1_i1:41-1621(+)
MAFVATPEQIIQQIAADAVALQQPIDEPCLLKLTELNTEQLYTLYTQFHDRVANVATNPIRNLCGLLFSLARGLLCGRIADAAGSTAKGNGKNAPSNGPIVPPRTSRAQLKGVRSLLEQSGIFGVDEAAIEKIEELSMEEFLTLLTEFIQAHNASPITSPSKWFFAKARTCLAQRAEARKSLQAATVKQLSEIPELPGFLLDEDCVRKISELEADERSELLQEFTKETQETVIRNPSSWLFSKARTRIVQRVSGRGGATPRALTNVQPLALPLSSQLSTQLAARLSPQLPVELPVQLPAQPHAQLPPELAFLLAAGISSEQSVQNTQQTALSGLEILASLGINTSSLMGLTLPSSLTLPAPSPSLLTPLTSEVSDLDKLTLMGVDAQAIEKLKELNQKDLTSLIQQFIQMYEQGQVNDPSKWLYAKARTILAQQAQGRRLQRQASGKLGAGPAGMISELGGVAVDADTLAKLEELTESEKRDLFAEFQIQTAITPIRNPSGWLFGKARSKVVSRLGGGKGQRSAPY